MKIITGNSKDVFWSSYLEKTPHDFYQLPKYVDLCAEQIGGEGFFICALEERDSLFLPLVKRSCGQFWDASSPYGYSGFLRQGAQPEFYVRAFRSIQQRLVESGFVSLFLRLHPILNKNIAFFEGQGSCVYHGDTVLINLQDSEEKLWKETISGHRNPINRSIKAGDRVLIESELSNLNDFVKLYEDTMGRVSAGSSYLFQKSYWPALQLALENKLFLASVFSRDKIVAAGLFTEVNGIVQYHLSGSDEEFKSKQPTKLMLHVVREWAKKRGNRWMHLGGGLGGKRDSLYAFKAGFSKTTQPFYTCRTILQSDIYRDLVRAHAPMLDPEDMTGYFPLYRS